jgi:hypothetical protein
MWNEKSLRANYTESYDNHRPLHSYKTSRVKILSLWHAYRILDEETKDKWERRKKMLATRTYSFSIVFPGFLPSLFLFIYKIIVFAQVEKHRKVWLSKAKTEKKKKKKTDQLESLLRCYLSGNKSTSLNHVCSIPFFFSRWNSLLVLPILFSNWLTS